jgi:hypothetical protein
VSKNLFDFAYQYCLLFSWWKHGFESKTFFFVAKKLFLSDIKWNKKINKKNLC